MCVTLLAATPPAAQGPWCHGTGWVNDFVYTVWGMVIRSPNPLAPSLAASLRKRPLTRCRELLCPGQSAWGRRVVGLL